MLSVVMVVGGITPPALAAVPGPTMLSPSDGQTLNYNGDFSVRVEPVAEASGYLYGFFQNSTMVWENYANERHLSGTEYTIALNTPAHAAIKPGALQIWARAMVNGAWTDATISNVTLAAGSVAGGEIDGNVSCDNNATPTQVHIQTDTGEGVDATITSWSYDKTNANYSAKMSTIQGGYNNTGTNITISVSCNGAPAGNKQYNLWHSPSQVWTENASHCADGKCD
jgi:hypothetical protein